MPEYKQLSQRHPCYSHDQWEIYEGLYKGGQELQELASKLLPALSVESPRQYQDRMAQALQAFEPHIATCVDQARNQLFTSPFSIQSLDGQQLDPFWADFQESCSSNGGSLDSFAADRFTQALIYGRSYWLVKFPSKQNQEPLSKAEWLERDLGRAWLQPLCIESVLNWDQDANGDLSWVTIHHKRSFQADPFSPSMMEETFQVFTRETVSTFQIQYDSKNAPKPNTEVPLISTETHGLGQVPLVCLNLEERDLALMPRGYQSQIHHWNLASGLSLATVRTCVPMTIIKTDVKEQISKMGDYGTVIGIDDSISLLTPDAASFEFQLNRLNNIKEQIFALCHFSSGNTNEPRERARSGYAREIDSSLTEVALKTFGLLVKEAIERTLNLIAIGRGESPRFDVTGLDSFTVAIKGMTIESAEKLLAMDLPDSFKREVKKVLRQKVLPGLSQPVAEELDRDASAIVTVTTPTIPVESAPELLTN